MTSDPGLAKIYGRWHKEIFADLAALLLGGPAAAWGMAIFLSHPAPRTLTFKPGGAHPTAYLRILILVEMLRRMGFTQESDRLRRVWQQLYNPKKFNRLPPRLLMTSARVIPEVVDEIAFQTRRNLAQRALADIIPFSHKEQAAIKKASKYLLKGKVLNLHPRHLVSAAGYALATGKISPSQLGKWVINHLNHLTDRTIPNLKETQAALVA